MSWVDVTFPIAAAVLGFGGAIYLAHFVTARP
jgi:hypothetical protein